MVRVHEELRLMGDRRQGGLLPLLGDAHPLVLRGRGLQREQEGLPGAEVRLLVAVLVALIALAPRPGAVRAEHLVAGGSNQQQRRLVLVNALIEVGKGGPVLLRGVDEFRVVHRHPHWNPTPNQEKLEVNKFNVSQFPSQKKMLY